MVVRIISHHTNKTISTRFPQFHVFPRKKVSNVAWLKMATATNNTPLWRLDTPLKINMEHVLMEVWFRSFSFLFVGDLKVPAIHLPGCNMAALWKHSECFHRKTQGKHQLLQSDPDWFPTMEVTFWALEKVTDLKVQARSRLEEPGK